MLKFMTVQYFKKEQVTEFGMAATAKKLVLCKKNMMAQLRFAKVQLKKS